MHLNQLTAVRILTLTITTAVFISTKCVLLLTGSRRGGSVRHGAVKERTIRPPVNIPRTKSVSLEMTLHSLDAPLPNVDLRRMKERAVWRTGYVL